MLSNLFFFLTEFGMRLWLSPNHMLQQCIVSHILLLYVVIFSMFQQYCMVCWGHVYLWQVLKFFLLSSFRIRFEFQPTNVGVAFSPSVFMSAIHKIYFFHDSTSFSYIMFVKICFGLTKRNISGSSSFGFFCIVLHRVSLVSYVCVLILALFNYLKLVLLVHNLLLKLNFPYYLNQFLKFWF